MERSEEDQYAILLVEDDPDRARLTRHAVDVSNADCRVTIASNGQEAIEHVEDPDQAAFDLVLLDLGLPDLSGHEVCSRIRSKSSTEHVPVVVLTSSDEAEDIRASYKVGANGHVAKRVDFDAFRDDMDAILSYWLDVNRAPSREA